MNKLYTLFTAVLFGLSLAITVLMVLHPVLLLFFVPFTIVIGVSCVRGAVTEDDLMNKAKKKEDVC